MELLKQPNNNPYPIELQIILVAYGTSGFADELKLVEFNKLKSLAFDLINYVFTKNFFAPVPHFIKYMTGVDLINLVNTLTKIFFSCHVQKR